MRVRRCDPPLPRRALLAAVTGSLCLTPLSGCRPVSRGLAASTLDPLGPVLTTAEHLAGRYQTVITRMPELAPRLTPLRDAHRAHALALRRELGRAEASQLPSGIPEQRSAGATGGSPGATPPPGDTATVVADLRELERSGYRQAADVCIAGPGYRAALLGSIAAARATHAEVLT